MSYKSYSNKCGQGLNVQLLAFLRSSRKQTTDGFSGADMDMSVSKLYLFRHICHEQTRLSRANDNCTRDSTNDLLDRPDLAWLKPDSKSKSERPKIPQKSPKMKENSETRYTFSTKIPEALKGKGIMRHLRVSY